MKKNLLFVVIAGLAVMTGCSKNEVIENTSTGEQDKMEFTSVVGKQTRAGEITSGILQQNGTVLNLYNHKTNGAFADRATGGTFLTFFDNQPEELTYNGSWSTAKEYEWTALNAGEKLSIFTFFSPKKVIQTITPATKTAAANFEYTVPNAITDQEDLLVATNLDMDKASAKGVIAINFKHALSQLYFKAKLTGNDYKAVIKSIKVLKASNKSKFSYAESDTDAGTWGALSGEINYIYAENLTQDITNSVTPDRIGNVADGSLMLMPQPAKANFQFEVTYNVVDKTSGAVMGANIVKTAEMAALEMGKKYAYTLILPKSENDKISFSVEVTEWDETSVTTNREVRFDEYALTGTDDAQALANLITGYTPSVIYLQEVKVTGTAISTAESISLTSLSVGAKPGSKVILDCTITTWNTGSSIEVTDLPTGWTADNGVSELTTNGKITITKN